MKLRILLLVTLSALVAPLRAQTPPAAPTAPAGEKKHHEPDTELGEHMSKIGRAFRALNKSVADATKNEDSLKLVATIRTNAEAALKLKPAKTADIPQDQQAKFLADYDADMKSFLKDVDSLEADLKAGNNQAATAVVKKMKQDMDASHKEFRKKKDDM